VPWWSKIFVPTQPNSWSDHNAAESLHILLFKIKENNDFILQWFRSLGLQRNEGGLVTFCHSDSLSFSLEVYNPQAPLSSFPFSTAHTIPHTTPHPQSTASAKAQETSRKRSRKSHNNRRPIPQPHLRKCLAQEPARVNLDLQQRPIAVHRALVSPDTQVCLAATHQALGSLDQR